MSEKVKKKNTIVKDAVILCLITLIAGLLLGFVYDITKEPIKKAEQNVKDEAYAKLFENAKSFETTDELAKLCEESGDFLDGKSYSSGDVTYDFSGITVDEIVKAMDGDELKGYVITLTTPNGYGGDIQIALGVDSTKTVTGLQILSINETPGLGMNATGDFKDQFTGHQVDGFVHTKNGKSADNEVDAITSATITTKAVTGAVDAGLLFAQDQLGLNGASDDNASDVKE